MNYDGNRKVHTNNSKRDMNVQEASQKFLAFATPSVENNIIQLATSHFILETLTHLYISFYFYYPFHHCSSASVYLNK